MGLEFYIFIPDHFEDDSVHCRPEQLDCGTFYFHTNAKAPNWAPPIINRHKIDITYKNKSLGIYRDILLKHLDREGNKDGSGLALRSIMRGDSGFQSIPRGSAHSNWSAEEIEFFKSRNETSIFNRDLKIIPREVETLIKPKQVLRVGVEKTNFGNLNFGFRVK